MFCFRNLPRHNLSFRFLPKTLSILRHWVGILSTFVKLLNVKVPMAPFSRLSILPLTLQYILDRLLLPDFLFASKSCLNSFQRVKRLRHTIWSLWQNEMFDGCDGCVGLMQFCISQTLFSISLSLSTTLLYAVACWRFWIYEKKHAMVKTAWELILSVSNQLTSTKSGNAVETLYRNI